MAELNRRRFLGRLAGAGVAGAGLVIGSTSVLDAAPASAATESAVAFRGQHQAGIVTDVQSNLAFAAYDVTTTDRATLVSMLKRLTAAAEAMTQGAPVPGDTPADTTPRSPARLTLTVGFGPSLFDDRFGLAARRPAALKPLPALPGDQLISGRSNGDIAVQACADDPNVAFGAIRDLTRIGNGVVASRWTQFGFGRDSSTGSNQVTPRNLMGFKDGTNNIRNNDASALNQFVWVGNGADQPWMRGGAYLVARRIRMRLEQWDRAPVPEQEAVFGRKKASGAPLTGTGEFDRPDFAATNSDGSLVIPADCHIRLAGPDANNGLRILRRSYSFHEGQEAGLFFIAFQSDPEAFVTLQRKLGSHDALDTFIQHTTSGLFACPGGLTEHGEDYWGSGLFET
ncbi:Dyp-type peroxidase [Pseudonocardia alaniniphila]|uniref:Dyp-type peroxidase n=1 Tax=Pseudonocardia alaniniphila TaxID=75291 RepID=A0ABS9THD1_9PSEU|nr:Dyp-type peroxidase [Pseudonocardia alaniniphila]MCH6167691.1 Dyp-type peroxidase [Pseudonocardia alaniniphila]